MTVKPIPDGYHAVTPYITARGTAEVVDFLIKAFGAKQVHEPTKWANGKIMHVELTIGDSPVMIAEETETIPATPVTLYLYVPDVDAVYRQAVKAGGKSIMEPMDMFYGDRCAGVKDASGNSWMIATHIEDIAPKELQKRADEHFKKNKQQQENKAA